MSYEMMLALLHATARQREVINAQLAREEKKENEKIACTSQAGPPAPYQHPRNSHQSVPHIAR